MLGVILFVIVLLFYSLILLELWDKVKVNSEKVTNFLNATKSFFDSGSSRFILALVGLIIGVWNLFAPDFGYFEGGPTVLGALLPSIAMCLSSVVLYPGIVEILNISQEDKQKYYNFINNYRGISGIVTLVIGVLHAIFFKIVLF